MSNAKQTNSTLTALKQIQTICSTKIESTEKREALNDIWRIANFAVHDAEKAARK